MLACVEAILYFIYAEFDYFNANFFPKSLVVTWKQIIMQ